MAQQQLVKPQIPTPDPTLATMASSGASPRVMAQVVQLLLQYLYKLVLYLQTYLNRVYNAIVPLQFQPAQISSDQSPYGVAATDVLVEASASSTASTEVDLPPATGSGRALLIMKMDTNPFPINVVASGTDTIGGSPNGINVTNQYDADWLIDEEQGNWLDYSNYAGLGWRITNLVAAQSPYTMLPNDVAMTITGSVTVNLPPATGSGRFATVVELPTGSGVVHPFSGDTINTSTNNRSVNGALSLLDAASHSWIVV